MNKGINIQRACFCPALDFGAGHVMSISVALLDGAGAPVRGKLHVAYDQEVKVQTVVELVHGLPGTITRAQTCSCFGHCSCEELKSRWDLAA
jgi:hypothetical protein